jgi:thiol-disulfide isomerase/thioredoxin
MRSARWFNRLAVVLVVVLLLGAARSERAVAQDEDGVAVGSMAPKLAVHDLDGASVDLGRFIGTKPVFLEFWATWCELCAQLMPHVDAAHKSYGAKVEFIGVNVSVNQTPARVRRYLAEHQPPFRTLYDDEGVSTRAYRVPTTSYVVIIDRTGKVVYTGSGGVQDFDRALQQVSAR